MPVTMKQVRALLEPEEPNYAEAARLGPEALPHLEKLVESKDPGIAAKAVSLAGFIGHPESARVLEKAAQSEDPLLRVAAAGAARYLPSESASNVLIPLIEDEDFGVQKTAIKSVPSEATPELQARIANVASQPNLSGIIAEALSQTQVQPSAGTAPPAGSTAEEFGEMPGMAGPQQRYSEDVSADELPRLDADMGGGSHGNEFIYVPVGPLQEMPGLAASSGEDSVSDVDQEMPAFPETSQEGDTSDLDQEMPGLNQS